MIVKFKLNNKFTSYVNIPCIFYSQSAMYLHRYNRGDAMDKWVIEISNSGGRSNTIGYFSTVEEAQRVLDKIAKHLASGDTPWFDVDLFLSKGYPYTSINVDLPSIPPIVQ